MGIVMLYISHFCYYLVKEVFYSIRFRWRGLSGIDCTLCFFHMSQTQIKAQTQTQTLTVALTLNLNPTQTQTKSNSHSLSLSLSPAFWVAHLSM
jgi:hypothetical protein